MIERIWEGETAVLVASGPSLRAEDVDYCRGRARMLVVNDNYRLAPWADALYAADPDWWRTYIEDVRARFRGMMWTQDKAVSDEMGLRWIESRDGEGLSANPSCIHRGHNSGFQALNLACLLGAARFVLLGYDMQVVNGRRHWFGDHPGSLNKRSNYGPFIRAFSEVKGVDVINCSRATALTCFPRAELQAVL